METSITSKILSIVFLTFFGLSSYAQENQKEMDIDLTTFCKDQSSASHEALQKERESICGQINHLQDKNIPPVTIEKKDDEGNKWKFRFHFGFSRTDYHPADLRIDSSPIKVVIKDVEMYERTSAGHYDPRTWEHFQDAGRWIDEPTNTFTFSMEKKNNIIYFTIFHPKYLKSLTYNKSQDGYDFQEVEQETYDFSSPIPEGSNLLYLGNTHMNMNWQIGYGRQFVILNSEKAGKLSYTIKGDVGISTGKARSVHIIPGKAWDDYADDMKVQGYNTSIGHRLEYQRGRVSLFIDQKTVFSKLKHGFYDGTIEYNLNYSPTTFGIGIDLFKPKKKKGP